MPTRLHLLAAGATAATREGRFPVGDEPLDAGGVAKVGALDWSPPERALCFVAPDAAARATAALLGIAGGEEVALRDQNHGDWAGLAFQDIAPGALAAWIAAPADGAPGGETLEAVRERVARWMEGLGDGAVVAVTYPAVLRVAVAQAMGVAVAATLAIDLAPLSSVILSRHDRWRVQEVRGPAYRRSR